MPAARIQLEHQRDFTGGLNVADDPYNMQPNESFDLRDVDIDRRGGFALRRGRSFYGDLLALSGTPDAMTVFRDTSNVDHIVVAIDGEIQTWDGAAWDTLRASTSTDTTFAEYEGLLYIAGHTTTHSWDGAAASTTSITVPGFNNDLATPANNRFPQAKIITVHGNVMWAANLADGQSRLRWSHPGSARDWRSQDYVDVDADFEGGAITALVPFGERLLVFRERGIYAVQGAAPNGFSVQTITRELGAPSAEAVCATEDGVFFWDTWTGVQAWDGETFYPIFRPLRPLVDNRIIDVPGARAGAHLTWHNDRLYVALPWSGDPFPNGEATLTYQPIEGSARGAWSLHSTYANAWFVYRPLNGDSVLLGAFADRIQQYDTPGLYQDEFDEGDFQSIDGHYTTRWFDGRNPTVAKRWLRPVVVLRDEATQTIVVDIFHDYDPATVKRSFNIYTTVSGAEGEWDVDDWDDAAAIWAAETGVADRSTVTHVGGCRPGVGTAVALRFRGLSQGAPWEIHGVSMKWINKRVRN